MAYFTPYIDASGLHIPTYNDIRDQLLEDARQIFGIDIYLGVDSQDYQWISTVARMIFDTCQAVELAYNNRSPESAIGTALDGLVKINGIVRSRATRSTAILQITGAPGTALTGRYAIDTSDRIWDITNTTIGPTGIALAIATCRMPGNEAAEPNAISKMGNPTSGWTSVTNPEAATAGQTKELDAALRARQALSTARPSSAILEGLSGDIMEIPNIGRTAFYENPTNEYTARGEPPHSITVVAEGGDGQTIAEVIYRRKTPGCGTYGTTQVSIANPYSTPTIISFFRPTYQTIYVDISLQPLSGYSEVLMDQIRTNVSAYINGLQIGENLVVSALYAPVLAATPSMQAPAFSVRSLTARLEGGTSTTDPIEIGFTELAQTTGAQIVIEVV